MAAAALAAVVAWPVRGLTMGLMASLASAMAVMRRS